MWAHVVGLGIFGLARGFSVLTAVLAVLPIAVCALLARSERLSRSLREIATTIGLLTGYAVLTAFWGGVAEAHFEFFVVVALLATYESWVPFLLAFVYVALHHGLFGTLWLHLIYQHSDPWLWAGVHAGFTGALGVICLLTWRLAEDQRDEFRAAFDRAPTGVALVDDSGVIVRGNQALARRLGVESAALEGIPLTSFLITEPRTPAGRTRRHKRSSAAPTTTPGARSPCCSSTSTTSRSSTTRWPRSRDRLLTVVAERLRNVVRPQDVIAHFGGDEFTVLLADVADETEARRVADRMAHALRGPIVLDGERRYVTASIGLSMSESADSQALLRDADAAMSRAKASGKARTSVFDAPMRQAAVERLELETALRGAVSRGELRLVFQPVVALPDGRVDACEALLRWDHPTLGRITPDHFIALAEQTGLIVQIGAWVVREACCEAAAWPEHIVVSVNVSPRQLGTTDLPDIVRVALHTSGLAPERLCLEIDKSFVDGIVSDAEDSAIVAGVVRLAHSLGLVAVAEGVEHSEQADPLARMGCQSAQGYLFARPQEADVISELLAGAPATS